MEAGAESRTGYRHAVYEPVGNTSLMKYYMNIIRRRFWIILTLFVIVFTIGLIRAFRATPIYSSSAKVLVERETPRMPGFEGVVNDSFSWNPEFYKTQADLVRSRDVLERAVSDPALRVFFADIDSDVIQDEGLKEDLKKSALSALGATPAPPAGAWERLRGYVSARHIMDTQFVRVTVEHPDPVVAAKIANSVARAYQKSHYERKKDVYNDALTLLKKEKEKEEQALTGSELALQDFFKHASVVSLTASEQDQPVIENLSRLSKQMTDVQLLRIELSSQIAVVKEILAQENKIWEESNDRLFAIPAIRDDPGISETHAAMLNARDVYENLTRTYGPEHPRLKAAFSEKELLEKQYKSALNQVIVALANKLRTFIKQEEQLRKEHSDQESQAQELTRELFEYTRLKNNVERHRRVYDAISDRLREVDVGVGFAKTNIEIVEEAKVPSVPIRPQKQKMLTMAAFIGLILGLGAAFLIENLDDIIKTPEDLKQYLSAPFLGFVPEIEDKDSDMTVFYRGAISIIEPVSSIAESYRNIRTSIYFSSAAGESQVICMTSCGPAEGKTTTCTNLALVMAKSGKKVLLVDADFHRPMVSRVFDLDMSFGLTNILIGEIELDAAVQNIQYDDDTIGNIDVLAAGPESPNPAELLGSHRMHTFLDEARQKYDWVIIDTPPVLFVSDASIVSAMSDSVIIVVKAGKNNHSVLKRTKDQLDSLNVHVMGSILNGMKLTNVGRYYSDYGYHGYSKYARDYHKSYYAAAQKQQSPHG